MSLGRHSTSDRHNHWILFGAHLFFFLTLFKPWGGDGFDNIFYHIYFSSLLFDFDTDLFNDIVLSNNNFWGLEGTLLNIAENGKISNWFAVGTALLWLPFFLVARVIGWIAEGMECEWGANRFSYPYLMAVSLGTMVYGYLTLALTYMNCRFFFRPRVSLLASLGAIYCSPLLYYIFAMGGMSHTPAAFASALLIYLTLRHRKFLTPEAYAYTSAALALVTLARWQNLLMGLIPLIVWIVALIRRRESNWPLVLRRVGIGAMVFLAIVSLQMVFWKCHVGSFLTVPQGGGYIQWDHPKWSKVLFSGWNGFYNWHPFLLIGTFGLLLPWRRRLWNWPLILLMMYGVSTYINVLPSDWFSGASFGARRFCASVPLLALGVAGVFHYTPRRGHRLLIGLLAFFLVWNVFQLVGSQRGGFGAYYLSEMWSHGWMAWTLYFPYLWTFPADSELWNLISRNLWGEALLLFTLGVGLLLVARWVFSIWLFMKPRVASICLAALIGFIFVINIINLLVTDEFSNPDGIRLREIISPEVAIEKKREVVEAFIDSETDFAPVYIYAVTRLQMNDRRQVCWDRIREISPLLAARWLRVAEFDAPPEYREMVQKLRKARPSIQTTYREWAVSADSSEARVRGWRRTLRYNPLDPPTRQTAIWHANSEGNRDLSEWWRLQEVRILRHKYDLFQSKRDDTVLTHRGEKADWSRMLYRLYFQRYYEPYLSVLIETRRQSAAMGLIDLNQSMQDDPWDQSGQALSDKVIVAASLSEDGRAPEEINALARRRIPPLSTDWFRGVAMELTEAKRRRAALQILSVGIEVWPNDPTLEHAVNSALAGISAEEAFMTEASTDSIHWWRPVATWFSARGMHVTAVRLFEDRAPTPRLDSWSLIHYARSLASIGRAEEALPLFEVGLREQADHPVFQRWYVEALAQAGRAAEARAELNRLLSRFPDNPKLKALNQDLNARNDSDKDSSNLLE